MAMAMDTITKYQFGTECVRSLQNIDCRERGVNGCGGEEMCLGIGRKQRLAEKVLPSFNYSKRLNWETT